MVWLSAGWGDGVELVTFHGPSHLTFHTGGVWCWHLQLVEVDSYGEKPVV